jgi:D-amino-acid oxidase
MKSVTVLGSGIVGLTTAIILQEAGFQVKLVAKAKFDKTVSHKVGAIWFPFEIHPTAKTAKWGALAYTRYQQEISPENGVSFVSFLTAYTSESNLDWTTQLPQRSVRKAEPLELPKGIEMGMIAEVPLAEPTRYLPYLFETFLRNGGSFRKCCISNMEELASLDEWVVNCSGLGARDICEDEDLHPMRGQILRCEKMDLTSFADPTRKGALLYVINRSEDCVIGGTDYEQDWNENEDPADTQKILSRLQASGLTSNPKILEVIVGLRPARSQVRFEFDPVYSHVFHNYGHGGAGFTVAWGCAMELAEIIQGNEIGITKRS